MDEQIDAKQSVEWKTDEFVYRKKNRDWFISGGIIAGALIIAAILFENWILALLIATGSFALMSTAVTKPRIISFRADNKGVVIDGKHYPYRTLESFGIDDTPTNKVLFKSQKYLMPLIAVPVPEDKIHEVTIFLRQHLNETELQEPLLQKIIEHFGM